MKNLLRLRWLLLIAFASLGGCASFQQHQVPLVKQMPDASHIAYKPSVLLTFKHFVGENPGAEMVAAEKQVRPLVEAAVLDSGLVDPTRHVLGDKTDLQIDVTIHDVGNQGLAMVSGFITGFSFFVIPGEATDDYKLELKVSDTSGKELTTIQNEDAINTWMGWIFLPFAGNTPKSASEATITNQIRAALIKAYEAGQLHVASPSQAAAVPAGTSSL